MPTDKKIVCRPRPWWPATVAMLVAFGFVWLMGWGLTVACLAAVMANVIVVIMTPPGRFGRWTE